MNQEHFFQVFLRNIQQYGSKPCLRYKKEGEWKSLSWFDVETSVSQIALGLLDLGIRKGDAVAIFASTRIEWTLCDLAILSIGAVSIPIYQSNTAEQAAYILENSESKLIFTENSDLTGRVRQRNQAIRIVQMTGEVPGSGETLPQLMRRGWDKKRWQQAVREIRLEDLATIVYTSGTTGHPKGALLTHRNIMGGMTACESVIRIEPGENALLFLPLAHILGREMQFYQLTIGFVNAYAESLENLIINIGEVRPIFFVGVPRVFEKIHERVLLQVEASRPFRKKIFHWAVRVGRKVSQLKQKGEALPIRQKLQYVLATLLVFQKLKKRLGGKLQFAISGGAPLSQEVAEFLHAADVLVLEGYGLTETFAAINCNSLRKFRFGSVGLAVAGVEEKIASDGEILVKGPMVFQGYFKNPEATAEVFTTDGWFRTGDIGQIDPDGFLKITDRKKDIIVTAGGKKVPPQNIENLLKTIPFVSQVMVHGDREKYLAALVTLNRESVEKFAKSAGIAYRDYGELVQHPRVYEWVQKSIEEKNRQLASYESVKKFAILENDFTQEAGELTPSLKVRRKYIQEKYREILNHLHHS